MSGMLRKMGEYFGFSGTEYDHEYDHEDEYADHFGEPGYHHEAQYAGVAPGREDRRFSSSVQVQEPRHVNPTRSEPPRRANVAPPEPPVRITTIHPTSYNDAKQMGELVRNGSAVIMNLSEMADDLARRLVDFGAGLTFGLGGSIDRVTARVFLMSPPNVSVSAEDRARIASGGFFNQS